MDSSPCLESTSTSTRNSSSSFQSKESQRKLNAYYILRLRAIHLRTVKALKVNEDGSCMEILQNVFEEVKSDFRCILEDVNNNNVPTVSLNNTTARLRGILICMRDELTLLFKTDMKQRIHNMASHAHQKDVLRFCTKGEIFMKKVFRWMESEILRTLRMRADTAEQLTEYRIADAVTDMLDHGMELLHGIFS